MVKKAERGTVIVLTLAGLTVILGVIGLAIDLGLMFDYKQRAQIAADAGALAAALSPAVYEDAAREMAKANGFEHNVGSIIVAAATPPGTGNHTGSENTDKYFEVTVTETYPTYFLKMIGIKTFPIEVRAVAEIGGTGGNCMAVGKATTGNNLKLEASKCNLYFLSLDDKKNINAAEINIDQPNPPAPGIFPKSSQFICSKESECDKGRTLTAGCYEKIEIKGSCTFGPGAYYIREKLEFERSAKATGSGVTFFLAPDSSFVFDGVATLTSGAAPDFEDVLFWSEGKEIWFGSNSKANLSGLIYAPEVDTELAGKIDLDIPSGGGGGASNKGLLVE